MYVKLIRSRYSLRCTENQLHTSHSHHNADDYLNWEVIYVAQPKATVKNADNFDSSPIYGVSRHDVGILTKDNGSSRVRPRGYRYGSLFLIIRAEIEITRPDVMSTQESTNDDRIDRDPDKYDATA